jgi:hypothetical protein
MDEPRTMMLGRWCGLLLLLSLMSGCGATTPRTPEATHAAWIAGLRAQDRAALLALMPDRPLAALFIDDSLRSLGSRLTAATDGPLEDVTLLPLDQDARGIRGVSAWRFRERTACYQTRLLFHAGHWTVTDWGLLARCPAGIR